ncbi:MAG TPA: serine/threonine-protein kinase [Ktedonobacteraceae bacterium]|nr:serine/threonine-protein kinase [Ktedonobacteraceae bacterium]
MGDRVGQHLGNYRLLRLLGKGGFAEVYLGEHRHLATQAAIKVLQAHLGSQADIESFRREAQTIAGLNHPHIMRVLDFDVEQDVPFLVMEYAPFGSLRTHHPRGQPLPLPLILLYMQRVASALQYAHQHKLVHRDVKPDNMLLRDEQTVILSDFGIVAIAHSTTSFDTEGGGAGTPGYMAPEQMQGVPRPASEGALSHSRGFCAGIFASCAKRTRSLQRATESPNTITFFSSIFRARSCAGNACSETS